MKVILNLIFFIFLTVIISSIVGAQLNNEIVSYYKLDDTSGPVFDSLSLHPGLNNGATRGVSGIINNAFSFDGINDDVNLSKIPEMEGNNLTINLWVNTTQIVTASQIIRSDLDSISWGILYRTGGVVSFQIANETGTNVDSGSTPASINDGEWHMITANFNSTSVSVYIDGTFNVTSDVPSGFGNVLSGQEVHLGSQRGTASLFEGEIDEVGLWNKTLSSNEILALYSAGQGLTYPFGTIFVSLESPVDGDRFTQDNSTFIANFTSFNGYNLTNSTFYLWNSSLDLINQTNYIITGTQNSSITEIIDLDFGDYTWNYEACTTNISNNECLFAPFNFSFSVEQFEITGITWENSTFDTDNSTFELNVSVEASAELFSGIFNYDGASYLANIDDHGSGSYTLTKTIDIPEVSAIVNKSFSWNITLDTGNGFDIESIDSNLQEVTPSLFILNQTDGNLNFTIINEDNLTSSSGQMKATFEWYLGSGTIIKNKSFDIQPSKDFVFENIPNNQNFYVSATILINNESITENSTAKDRIFQFNKLKIGSEQTKIELPLSNSSLSRNVIIEVKDEGLSPIKNILVEIDRFYPQINEYKTVESRITDNFGQFSGTFIENDVSYLFRFYNLNKTLLKTEESISLSCRNVICILPFVIDDTQNPFTRYSILNGFDYDFSFNTNTNTTLYTWNDITGYFDSARLEITLFAANGSVVVYNVSSIQNPNTLSYNAGDSRGSYTAQIYRTDTSGNEIKIDTISFSVGVPSNIFGFEGLMWSFILLFTMMAIGIFSPVVGIVLYLTGFILLGLTGIVYIHPGILIAEIIIGVMFIWAFRG